MARMGPAAVGVMVVVAVVVLVKLRGWWANPDVWKLHVTTPMAYISSFGGGVAIDGGVRMSRLTVLALGSVVFCGILSVAAGDDKPAADPPKGMSGLYPEFKADQALLRKHLVHKAKDGGKDTKASSGEACEAAVRIFTRVPFLFRTRDDVLELLGDPATISDYNRPPDKGAVEPAGVQVRHGPWGAQVHDHFRATRPGASDPSPGRKPGLTAEPGAEPDRRGMIRFWGV